MQGHEMTELEGSITQAQHEILEVIWASAEGATVAEVWQAIAQKRKVTRTTILNQIDRLEDRGWLKRHKGPNGNRYVATVTRQQASRSLVSQFVDAFFGGSATQLVSNLLGAKKLKKSEIEQLRKLLDKNN